MRLSTQLLILVVSTVLLTIVLLVVLSIIEARAAAQREINQRATALTEATSKLLSVPLTRDDSGAVAAILTTMVRDNALDGAFVFRPDGTLLAQQMSAAVQNAANGADDVGFARAALRAGRTLSRLKGDHLNVAVPIFADGRTLGVLLGKASFTGADAELAETIPRMVTGGILSASLAGLLAILIARYIASPLKRLALATTAVGRGELDTSLAIQRGGEIGALAVAFQQMVTNLRIAQAEVAEQRRMLEQRVAERTADLERTLAELRASITERDQLLATVRALSSPVVPVMDGILVMPLIGVVDSQRASVIVGSLLHAIEHHRARYVIMDVTGVPLIDTQVARVMLNAAAAAKLLGAQTILVGVRPEVAQTIVGLGLDLSSLVTRADLQSGVAYAIEHQHRNGSVPGRRRA